MLEVEKAGKYAKKTGVQRDLGLSFITKIKRYVPLFDVRNVGCENDEHYPLCLYFVSIKVGITGISVWSRQVLPKALALTGLPLIPHAGRVCFKKNDQLIPLKNSKKPLNISEMGKTSRPSLAREKTGWCVIAP